MTSPVLVYFSLSERFLTGLSPKNAIYDELNVSCLDEVVPSQKEFKSGEDKIVDLLNTSFKDIPDYYGKDKNKQGSQTMCI
jgi:hypothetical protein